MLCPYCQVPMELAQETPRMHVWTCGHCQRRPRNWQRRHGWNGTLVLAREADVRPMTPDRYVDRAVKAERARQQREADAATRQAAQAMADGETG